MYYTNYDPFMTNPSYTEYIKVTNFKSVKDALKGEGKSFPHISFYSLFPGFPNSPEVFSSGGRGACMRAPSPRLCLGPIALHPEAGLPWAPADGAVLAAQGGCTPSRSHFPPTAGPLVPGVS